MAFGFFEKSALFVGVVILYLIYRAIQRTPLKEIENPIFLNTCYVVKLAILHESSLGEWLSGDDEFGYSVRNTQFWTGKKRWNDDREQVVDGKDHAIAEAVYEIFSDLPAANMRFKQQMLLGMVEGAASHVALFATSGPKTVPCDVSEIAYLARNGKFLKASKVHVKQKFRRPEDPLFASLRAS